MGRKLTRICNVAWKGFMWEFTYQKMRNQKLVHSYKLYINYQFFVLPKDYKIKDFLTPKSFYNSKFPQSFELFTFFFYSLFNYQVNWTSSRLRRPVIGCIFENPLVHHSKVKFRLILIIFRIPMNVSRDINHVG